jgi:hypothetical protein
MTTRVLLTIRIQPEYLAWVKRTAASLRRSEGYVIEECIYQQAHDFLRHLPPGRKMTGDDDRE